MDTIDSGRPEGLVTNLRQLISGSEDLVNTVRKNGGREYGRTLKRIDRDIEEAKEQLGELQHTLTTRMRSVGRKTDRIVSSHPWETAGTVAAAGALLGVAIGVLIVRSNSH